VSTEAQTAADAGVEGNSRLTSVTGMVLFVLLAVEGVTILSVRQMITLHIYLGVLLVGPVLLKCATTMYRFARYYAGAAPYVRKGPPHVILRVLGPVVVASTVALLGTGIALIATGPVHRQPWITLHQASFIIWVGVMAIHVLGHALTAGNDVVREYRSPRTSPIARRRTTRLVAVALSLMAGVGLATALMPSAHSWTSGQFQQDRER
jgi:hypothetical protein